MIFAAMRLCAAQHFLVHRAPLVSLLHFNPCVSPPLQPSARSGRWNSSKAPRSVIVQSGKRNIFLNPQDVKNASFEGLYDSSRFNEDDEGDLLQTQDELSASVSSTQEKNEDVLVLPRPKQTKVKTAEFIKSSVSVKDCPKAGHPEFAVIGRSNVGKSSLINLLTGRKALAMVSKTPGKTRCINHFLINNNWYLVDLPGYGYAKQSKESVLSWNKFTREYFVERDTLVAVLLLVDASIPPMPLDIACADWLGDAEIPYSVVFTKVDKKKKGCPAVEENIEAFQKELLKNWEELPPMLATSSRAGSGKAELLAHIAQLREAFKKAGTL